MIGGVTIVSGALLLLIVRTALSARRRQVVSGVEEMVGAPGTVLDWRGGSGHVFVHGERWHASADARLRQGQAVRITDVRGLTVRVEAETARES